MIYTTPVVPLGVLSPVRRRLAVDLNSVEPPVETENGTADMSRIRMSSAIRTLLCALFLAIAVPAHAQLDASCTVAALNRSARVDDAGVWVLPNVPANTGRVRVRATCVADDGSLRSGQSDFFVIPTNGVVPAPEIVFDAPEPVPATLQLSSQVTTLTSIGAVAQLTATATYADGSSADVTPGSAGTNYQASNPAIASVSTDGAVTAHVSGNVLVSALNEGALAVLRLAVVLSGDSDGDGLPDDFELANGLDPNNPVDVLDDQDGDGLSTAEEFGLGLDPFDPDSDDDSLLDGEEVTVVGTDPLLFDTDGDGVSDGLEVTAGSDPLDPSSISLAGILEDLEVFPAVFDLVFNTAVGEASRRLEVTGRLVDGTALDLRSSRYGTTYASSDLAVASFGAEDGRVFAGQDGTATITVAVGGLSATSVVTVTTFAPMALASLSLPGYANGVAVEGGYAYVASGRAGVHVVDALDPEHPVLLATVDTPGNANDIRASGRYVYVADGSEGVAVIDVADPTAPFVSGRTATGGSAIDLAVAGEIVFVADGLSGVTAVDVSDPGAPEVLDTLNTPGFARGIDTVDGLVVVADLDGGVQIIDGTDPSNLIILGSTPTRPSGSRAADVVVRGRTAYVADGAWNLGGLRVVDFRQPSTPILVGSTSDEFGLVGVALEDNFAVTADYYFVNAAPIFDIGTTLPTFTAAVDFSGPPGFFDDEGNGVAVEDGLVYLAAVDGGVVDNGTEVPDGKSRLHIGRYRVLQDLEGVPPTVSLVEPAPESAVLERRRLTILADASDDVRVVSVRFVVDGEVVAEDFRAPFETAITVPVGVPNLTIEVVAVDLAGNEGTAEPVVVEVIPDDAPFVELLSPHAGTFLSEGGQLDVVAAASDDLALTAVEILIDGVPEATLTAPPYRYTTVLPIGTTSVTVEVRAHDELQVATTGPRTFVVAPDLPPTVQLVEPAAGSELIAGALEGVLLGAGDDLGVARVGLIVDGAAGPEDPAAPYELAFRVPTGVTEVTLQAYAVDTLGQQSVTAGVVFEVVADPGTVATGLVRHNGVAVAGATVECLGVSGVSGVDGTFAIPGVPTLEVEISCSATYTDASGASLSGISTGVAPVPGGVTDVGVIALVESLFEDDIGPSLFAGFPDSIFLTMPFGFPFFGETYTGVWINTSGNLTFTAASPDDWTEDAAEFVSGFRDADGIEVGPAIAPFWDDLIPLNDTIEVERDLFRFQGSAGDAVAAEVHAQRIGSRLDSILTLYSGSGAVLAFNDDFAGLDSRVELVLPTDGTYFLEVEEYARIGGEDFVYTLTLEGGGAPPTDAGAELEPNDTFATASQLAYGHVVSGVLLGAETGATRNIHVNDQLPGRFVVTWNDVPELPEYGSNTVQVILFEDGRVQLGYQGVTSDDSIVGISPSDGTPSAPVDFSAAAPFSTSAPQAIFEEFDGPNGPDWTDEDPAGTTPFDLDGTVLVFTPNAAGGFDVAWTGLGFAGSPMSVVNGAARFTAASTSAARGILEGRVRPEGVETVEGIEVIVTSSTDLAFEARATTDSAGRFRVEDVPVGGVHARVASEGGKMCRAAGVLRTPGAVLELVLRPLGNKSVVE